MQPQFIPPVVNPKRSKSKLPIILIAVVVLFAIIGGVMLLISTSKNSPVNAMDKLNARMTSLASYVAEGRKSARSADLVKLNSDAVILITGDVAALKTATAGAGAKGTAKEAIAEEKARAKSTLDDLKSASVDGRFDREYVSTLKEELSETQILLREVNEKSSSSDVKDATKSAYEHMSTLIKALDDLSL